MRSSPRAGTSPRARSRRWAAPASGSAFARAHVDYEIGTAASIKQALLDARSVTYAQDGASRPHIERMFEQLGIAAEMKAKTLLEQGSVRAAEKVVAGEAEILLTLVSEILPVEGLELLGPLPDEFQSYISFAAAVGTHADERRRRTSVHRLRRGAGRCADLPRTRNRAMRRLSIALVAAACCMPAAQAHHSTALVYNRDGSLIEAEGVITEVAWVNPHVRFEMRGAGADGVERLWEIESNSVSIISRFGLTAELVAAGTRVKVAGNGGRQADNVLWLTNMLLPSGQEILFGAGVRPRWSQQTIGGDTRSAVAADSQGLGIFRVWTNVTSPPAFWGNNLPLTPSASAARAAFDPLADDPTAELRAERHAVHH